MVIVESVAKGSALPFHRHKLVLVLSAMHHFAKALRDDGYDVDLRRAPTYVEGIAAHVRERGASEVIAMLPREWGLGRAFDRAQVENTFGVPLTLHDDGGEGGHFLLTRREFADWARGRKQLRMADFYRWMRKRTGWLMDDGKPVGGKFSFDVDNRGHARGHTPPAVPTYRPDAITKTIVDRVRGWSGRWGDVDGFDWPVTADDASAELDAFFADRAADFGRFQDAMLSGQTFMWHTRISAAMNLGLLHPRRVCERIVAAFEGGRMPLAAAEGLLRQILGWREFIRGVYWHRMPGLREANLLQAHRPLPDFYWDPSRTDMACMRDSVGHVLRTGYAHHIERLMVLGNFALLAGVDPRAISHWFWAGFVDAYEWVELPNVVGMAVYADDTFTTKPYAASGNYIQRMSDHCRGCRYDVKARAGSRACPFNPLYWHFMVRHRARLSDNPRLRVLYGSWDRLADAERAAVLQTAEQILDDLRPSPHAWRFDDDNC